MGYDPLPEDLDEVDCHFNLSEPLPSCVPNSVQLIATNGAKRIVSKSLFTMHVQFTYVFDVTLTPTFSVLSN